MKGTWTGYYQYNDQWAREAVGFERTGFTIQIEVFDGTHFEGTVHDDIATGGMKETGRITGHLKNGRVSFRKFMPRSYLIHPDGTTEYTEQEHRTLYYTGQLTEDKGTASGKWKFRIGIIFLFRFIPVPYKAGSGTWHMSRQ